MRLLQRHSGGKIDLSTKFNNNIPCYTILSHTWGDDAEEVSFDDVTAGRGDNKKGYQKIQFCAQRAEADGCSNFWIDTCCIDRANHTELAEAIASMFRWYQNAAKCYVFLSDVSARDTSDHNDRAKWEAEFRGSRWFTRGWTLQELLAPSIVEFYSREGQYLGDKRSLERLICAATRIPTRAIQGAPLSEFSVEDRLSWASGRRTTRKEDEAYCLQGICNVFIPLIYGEREHAFQRLKRAIDERWTVTKREDLNRMKRTAKRRRLDDVNSSDAEDCRALQSLAFPEMYNRRLSLEPHHQNTCRWILKTPEYKQWVSSSRSLLWIKGKPGAGKSTVMAFLYSHLENGTDRHIESPSSIKLTFFLAARGTELQRTFCGVLRSFLHQLFSQDIPTQQHLGKVVKEKNISFGDRPDSWEWQLSELKSLFTERVIAAADQREVILFVDALDEAGEVAARAMAKYFHWLRGQAAQVHAYIKICMSCRHYPIVTNTRDRLEVVVEKHNHQDIAAFIHDTLALGLDDTVSSLESMAWLSLESDLIERAQGVFQWAFLVVSLVQKRIDKGESAQYIQQRLQDVPAVLKDIYIHIIRHVIDEEDRMLSFRLFQWVCLAARPLMVAEIRYALTLDGGYFSIDSIPNVQTYSLSDTEEHTELRIQSLSGGLLEVAQGCVQVGHQSISDFMLAEGLALSASLSTCSPTLFSPLIVDVCIDELKSLCHARLYWSCLSYILTEGALAYTHVGAARVTNRKCVTNNKCIQFFYYAILDTFYHAERAGSYRTQNLLDEIAILNQIIPVWQRVNRWLRWDDFDGPGAGTQLLHLASEANLQDVVEHLLRDGCNVDLADSRGRTALHLAARQGHQDIAGLLLKAGANTGAIDRSLQSAIAHAASQGRLSMVRWLLTYGASTEPAGWQWGGALHEAAAHGCVELARILLQAGAKVDVQSGEYCTALQVASAFGHSGFVQILLDAGANVNICGGAYVTALQAASSRGYKAIVMMLLEAGAAVNSVTTFGSSALQAASASGHENVMRVLIEAGADVNIQAGFCSTALFNVSENGQKKGVQMLLDAGADVNKHSESCRSALQAASMCGHTETVKILLAAGADVDMHSEDFASPLQAASEAGYDEIVQILIKAGANIDLCAGGLVALQTASRNCHETVVRILLDAGADVNAKAGYAGTAMQAALRGGNSKIIQMLRDAGAV